MPDLVKGSDVILSVHNGAAYAPLLCSTDCSFSTQTEKIDTTTTGSGSSKTYAAGRHDRVATLSGATVIVGEGPFYLMRQQESRALLQWKMEFTDAAGEDMVITFNGIITASDVNGPATEYSNFNIEIQVSGIPVFTGGEAPGGIADTVAPFITAAYVTDDQRNRIVLEFSEPLSGYRISDGVWYPNLSHYSVWSNVDGSKIYIFTNADYEEGQDIRLTYSGGEVMDASGNQTSAFTNLPVENRIGAGITQFTAWWGWVAEDPTDSIFVMGDDSMIDFEAGLFAYDTPIYADFHLMPVSQYAVVKEPVNEPQKTTWVDNGATFNNGSIPDSVFKFFEKDGFRYYITRTPMTFDNKATSRVVFS